MKISDKIRQQIEAIRTMNFEPSMIYIGRKTYQRLEVELGVALVNWEKPHKTIYGVSFLLVNKDEHLDVTMVRSL